MNTMGFVSESYSQYRSRLKKRKDTFEYAKSTSKEEIAFNIQKIFKSQNKKEALRAIVSMTNSSVWLSRSAFVFLKSFFDLRYLENINHGDSRSQEIISGVSNHIKINASDVEVFKTIYSELTFSHLHQDYKCSLVVPKTDVTIVLISGVFNEIFSTPAFKRGAEKLLDDHHVKHINPIVDGTKGAKENALAIKKQVDDYLLENPNEKLWFFCFSKGGVDTLHYLKHEGQALAKNIIGISFIATPILGSDHLNNKILKLINNVGRIPEEFSKKLVGKNLDLFAKELQKSLSKSYRENWFKKNHKHLSKDVFYTSLAFESKWHKSHVWMMFTKAFFRSQKSNDGIVDVENAQFPSYFNGMNLGVLEGHHLVGSRSSYYDQEALMKSHLIFLRYKKLL